MMIVMIVSLRMGDILSSKCWRLRMTFSSVEFEGTVKDLRIQHV